MYTGLLIWFVWLVLTVKYSTSSRILPRGNLRVFLRSTGCVDTADCSWFDHDMDVINLLPFNFSNPYTKFNLNSDNHVTELEINNEHEIPLIIYCLKNLEKLSIWYSNITSIPADIQNLQKLRELRLGNMNQLSKLPDTIGNLSALERLDIELCDKVTYLPRTIANLYRLQELRIRFTRMTELPVEITGLWQLRKLVLDANHQLSYLPRGMSRLYSLTYLELAQTDWTSLDELVGIPNLQELRVWASYDSYVSEFPPSISNLTTLRFLDLQNNRLTSLPIAVSRLKNLTHFYLWNNKLAKLPRELTLMKNLEMLGLSNNPIRDISGVGSIVNLRCLQVRNCQLQFIPSEIVKLSKTLEVLELSLNNITHLPKELSNLENLKYLYLHGNPLSSDAQLEVKNMFQNNTKVKIVYENMVYGHDGCYF